MEPTVLLRRCRAGDPLAWEVLVREYQGRILGITYGYVGDPDEARDLAQEVFLRIYQRLDRCRDPRKLTPWMVRITRNLCLDHLRRKKARPPRLDLPVEDVRTLASSEPGPEEQTAAEARRSLVHRALRTLGNLSREIILLKEIQDLALDEVASILGIPVGTVKSRLHRARIELARAVLALGGDPAPEGGS